MTDRNECSNVYVLSHRKNLKLAASILEFIIYKFIANKNKNMPTECAWYRIKSAPFAFVLDSFFLSFVFSSCSSSSYFACMNYDL